jgi:hypothetical protein
MIADSKRLYVVSLLATLAVLFAMALVVVPQRSQIQQATLVSLTTRPVPRLDVVPAAAPASITKTVQTSTGAAAPKTAAPVVRQAPVIQSVSVGASNLPAGLLCIRGPNSSRMPWGESNADYRAISKHPPGVYTGAYEYDDPTWGDFMGYPRAYLAPPAVQDAKALSDYNLGMQSRHRLWPHTSIACGV